MKKYYLIIFAFFLSACSCDSSSKKELEIDADTLFEKMIPVLDINDEFLKNELDSIVEEIKYCEFYIKDTSCFGIARSPIVYLEDTIIGIGSNYRYEIDFSDSRDSFHKTHHPLEWRREETIHGCFVHKGFVFYCSKSIMTFTDLFYETGDSVKVKNDPYVYKELLEPEIDDRLISWTYIYKNRELIVDFREKCR